jgi:hypothetical protein
MYTVKDPVLIIDAIQAFNIYRPPNCLSGETMTVVKIGYPQGLNSTVLPAFSTFDKAQQLLRIYATNNVKLG